TQLNPMIVVLDLRLPGVDGFEVCRMIRHDAHLSEVKILAISGYAEDAMKSKILKAGADDFMAKPFDNKELIERLAKLLEGAKSKAPGGREVL
ncbi:MAG: response regulator, partial [Elusimicrobia bacterium]|nr:response regulator [Elusimicrobiota bacterium]